MTQQVESVRAVGNLDNLKKDLTINYEGRSEPAAAPGSAEIRKAHTQFAQNAPYLAALNQPDTEAYAVVHQTDGANTATDAVTDDTLMAEVKYDGLKSLNVVSKSDNGLGTTNLDATITNASAAMRLRDEGGLLECARVHGHWYGTPIGQVRGILAAGRAPAGRRSWPSAAARVCPCCCVG